MSIKRFIFHAMKIKIIDLLLMFWINAKWSLQNYREKSLCLAWNSDQGLHVSPTSMWRCFVTFWRIFCRPLEPSEYSITNIAPNTHRNTILITSYWCNLVDLYIPSLQGFKNKSDNDDSIFVLSGIVEKEQGCIKKGWK